MMPLESNFLANSEGIELKGIFLGRTNCHLEKSLNRFGKSASGEVVPAFLLEKVFSPQEIFF